MHFESREGQGQNTEMTRAGKEGMKEAERIEEEKTKKEERGGYRKQKGREGD